MHIYKEKIKNMEKKQKLRENNMRQGGHQKEMCAHYGQSPKQIKTEQK